MKELKSTVPIGTTQLKIQYQRNDKRPKFIGYVDDDWASNIVLYVYSCIVYCNSKNMESKICKHIDVKHHFIPDNINKGNMKIQCVSISNQNG